jgi:uncharacterized protein YdeI (YjbR/CyaY-like superfamily)
VEPTGVLHFERPEAFRDWLREHHESEDSLWVGFWKKGTGRASITWPEAVDEALCVGWIDGIRRRLDDEAYTIRFTPRRPTSVWSLRNVERYEALTAQGRIREAGRVAWERRKEAKTGIYSFERTVPAELPPEAVERIRAEPRAWADWSSRPAGYVRKVSHWIMSAKKEETRERRLQKLIDDLAAGRAD